MKIVASLIWKGLRGPITTLSPTGKTSKKNFSTVARISAVGFYRAQPGFGSRVARFKKQKRLPRLRKINIVLTLKHLAIASFVFFSIAGFSAQKNSLPLFFNSDTAEFDQKTGVGEYHGHVTVDQGDSHLRAIHAKTYTDKQHKLLKAIALGTPAQLAHYWTVTQKDKPELHAKALTIEYYPKEKKVILIGDAIITQGKNTFHAPIIEYDILRQHVISRANSKGKTTIVFEDAHKKLSY